MVCSFVVGVHGDIK